MTDVSMFLRTLTKVCYLADKFFIKQKASACKAIANPIKDLLFNTKCMGNITINIKTISKERFDRFLEIP